jgi:hypothetical protein
VLHSFFSSMISFIEERRLPTAAYPIRGFAHFLSHPKRHAGPMFFSITKVLAASAVVVIPMYRFGFHYQKKLIAQVYSTAGGRSTYVSSILVAVTSSILFFLETSAVTLQLGSHFIGNIRNILFDSVLEERKGLPSNNNDEDLASISEKVAGSSSNAAVVNHHVFLAPTNLMILSAQGDDSWSILFLKPAVFLMTLPLNIIPVFGPICFVSIQALFRGGMAHRRYFQLYKWSPAQRQRRIENYFWQYQTFGMVATALEMIPFVGYLFMYTNQIG